MFSKLVASAILALFALGQGALAMPQTSLYPMKCGAATVPRANTAASPAQYRLSGRRANRPGTVFGYGRQSSAEWGCAGPIASTVRFGRRYTGITKVIAQVAPGGETQGSRTNTLDRKQQYAPDMIFSCVPKKRSPSQ
ncbi:hypothetical protein FB45DRAFT_868681 [Roridomyces roridus]|uniref:Uncharacterized protein n=1 Tax=Roridomyces roridus TaxID=1738132 RepID=A0AAD7BQB8_9AGAR|nr:hypothetical protein FB45DRAFT_868681 [Roridomyces roridus]